MKEVKLPIDPLTEKQAERIFASVGLDLPTAIYQFLMKSILLGKMPFELTDEERRRFATAKPSSLSGCPEDDLLRDEMTGMGDCGMSLEDINQAIAEARQQRKQR